MRQVKLNVTATPADRFELAADHQQRHAARHDAIV